jgi:hypothetical protein
MFWTDDKIQTSFTTNEILLAIGIFLLITIYALIRKGLIFNKHSNPKVIYNFIKLFTIPLLLAVFYIFFDSYKFAQIVYGEDNVVKSDYKHKAKKNVLSTISKVSGNTVYKWDGKFLTTNTGKKLIKFENNFFMTASGKKLLKWEDESLLTIGGKRLFKYENKIISKQSGKNIYKIEMDKVYKISGSNILEIKNPYDLPNEILVFAVLHFEKKI